MSFLEKMKNLFTEEEEIIEPVKSEVMQVEIKAPVNDEVITPTREELNDVVVNPPKAPEKPAPVFFDDKDFATLDPPKPKPKPKPEPKPKPIALEPTRPIYQNTKKGKDKQTFKPSPIISPVYGILDKNYKKEDLVERHEDEFVRRYYTNAKEVTLDDVRQKAFGTLEDDIDLNLNTDSNPINLDVSSKAPNNSLESDIFEEMDDTKSEGINLDVEDNEEDINLGNSPENDKKSDNVNLVEEEMTKEEKLDDSDLFNLIDSMYEKRDEK